VQLVRLELTLGAKNSHVLGAPVLPRTYLSIKTYSYYFILYFSLSYCYL